MILVQGELIKNAFNLKKYDYYTFSLGEVKVQGFPFVGQRLGLCVIMVVC